MNDKPIDVGASHKAELRMPAHWNPRQFEGCKVVAVIGDVMIVESIAPASSPLPLDKSEATGD